MDVLMDHADYIENVRIPELRWKLESFEDCAASVCGEEGASEAIDKLSRAIKEYEAIVDNIRTRRSA